MAVIIKSPKDYVVDISTQDEGINIEWEDSTGGQEAYELQYKFKKSDLWSTCGKVYDSEARTVPVMNIYNLVEVDFYEVYYRIVIYYNGTNELGPVNGIETSDAYTLIFRHGIMNTLYLYDGTGTFDYPLYDDIAINTFKTNGEVLAEEVSLDDDGNHIMKLPLVDPDNVMKGKLKVCIEPRSEHIKTVANPTAVFVNTHIYGTTYINQTAEDDESTYAYDYIDVYQSYHNYGSSEYYGYRNYYDYSEHYDYYQLYDYSPYYDYREEYNTGPTYDYYAYYQETPFYRYNEVDVYVPEYYYYSDYREVDVYGIGTDYYNYVSGSIPIYRYINLYETTYYYRSETEYVRYTYYYYSPDILERRENVTEYGYRLTGYRTSSSTVQDGYYKITTRTYSREYGYFSYYYDTGRYAMAYSTRYKTGTKYGGTYTYYTSEPKYNSRGRQLGYYYVRQSGRYYVTYSQAYQAFYYYRQFAEAEGGYTYYTSSTTTSYAPRYKTVYRNDPVYESYPYSRTRYYYIYIYATRPATDYMSRTYYRLEHEDRYAGRGSEIDYWETTYSTGVWGYYYYYQGRSTGLYYGSEPTGNYYKSYTYYTPYVDYYQDILAGYLEYYAGLRYDLYYAPYQAGYYDYGTDNYDSYVDSYYSYVAGQNPYPLGYYNYYINTDYYVDYTYSYSYISYYFHYYYNYTYYRS